MIVNDDFISENCLFYLMPCRAMRTKAFMPKVDGGMQASAMNLDFRIIPSREARGITESVFGFQVRLLRCGFPLLRTLCSSPLHKQHSGDRRP